MAETVRDATDRSERLIDSLLVLARSDAAGLADERCDRRALARAAIDASAAELRERELDLDVSFASAEVDGDASLLDRAVANLVENAIRHNLTGGWVTIETSTAGATASIRVANSGPRLDEDDVATLFERFHRADASRARHVPGFGLGLSIVAAVASAHHGTVVAAPLDGGGIAVTLSLPAARAPASAPVRSPDRAAVRTGPGTASRPSAGRRPATAPAGRSDEEG